jgi:membrane protein required for colicin V production
VNWLDFVFLVFLVVFAFQGLAEGFSRLIVGLVATVAGLLIASWCYDVPASFLLPYVSSKAVANVLGFVLVFVLIQALGGMAGLVLSRVFRWTGLGWLDRLLGFAFGALKAVLVGVVLVLILTAFPIKPVPDSVAHSEVAPYLIDAAHVVTYLAPRELRQSFRETYDRIREFWRKEMPKEKPETERSQIRTGDTDLALYLASLDAGRVCPPDCRAHGNSQAPRPLQAGSDTPDGGLRRSRSSPDAQTTGFQESNDRMRGANAKKRLTPAGVSRSGLNFPQFSSGSEDSAPWGNCRSLTTCLKSSSFPPPPLRAERSSKPRN